MKVLGAILLGTIIAATFFVSPTAADTAETRAMKPRVLCLNYGAGNFYVRSRPARCDYYAANAPTDPVTALAIAPTKSVRWTRWGSRIAYGKGRYHVNGPGFIPARFRLLRPRYACGRLMFTKLKVRIYVSGDGWQRWGRGAIIKACP